MEKIKKSEVGWLEKGKVSNLSESSCYVSDFQSVFCQDEKKLRLFMVIIDLSDLAYIDCLEEALASRSQQVQERSLIVAVINQVQTNEFSGEQGRVFDQGTVKLKGCCNLVVINLCDMSEQEQRSGYDKSRYLFNNVLLRAGSIESSFIDFRIMTERGQEGYILSSRASGLHRIKEAVEAVLQHLDKFVLAMTSSNSKVSAILIDITADEMSLSEFDEVGNKVYSNIDDEVTVTIGMTEGEAMKDELILSLLLVV